MVRSNPAANNVFFFPGGPKYGPPTSPFKFNSPGVWEYIAQTKAVAQQEKIKR